MRKATKRSEQSEPEKAEVGSFKVLEIGSFKVLELNVKVLDCTLSEMESQYRVLIREEHNYCILESPFVCFKE